MERERIETDRTDEEEIVYGKRPIYKGKNLIGWSDEMYLFRFSDDGFFQKYKQPLKSGKEAINLCKEVWREETQDAIYCAEIEAEDDRENGEMITAEKREKDWFALTERMQVDRDYYLRAGSGVRLIRRVMLSHPMYYHYPVKRTYLSPTKEWDIEKIIKAPTVSSGSKGIIYYRVYRYKDDRWSLFISQFKTLEDAKRLIENIEAYEGGEPLPSDDYLIK